jgi:hypothetical protein
MNKDRRQRALCGQERSNDSKTMRLPQVDPRVAAGTQNWLADLMVEARNAEETLRAVEGAN